MRTSSAPSTSPMRSVTSFGSQCISSSIFVLLSPSGTKRTMPSLRAPDVLRHEMILSGTCSVISASHSSTLPPTFARQCRRLSSSCWTASMPSMNRGNSSNWVHWSYATRTGTSTSMDFFTVGMSMTPPLLCCGSVACWRSPSSLRPSRRAAFSPREASESAVDRRDCGESPAMARGHAGASAVPAVGFRPAARSGVARRDADSRGRRIVPLSQEISSRCSIAVWRLRRP